MTNLSMGLGLGSVAFQRRAISLGPELWVAANYSVQNALGSTGVWGAATQTLTSSGGSTNDTFPRLRRFGALVIGERYQVEITSSGDTAALVRAGRVEYVNATSGALSGIFTAGAADMNIDFDGRGSFSITLSSVSLRQVL